jgi:FkbM family methyltransferase
LQSFVTWISDKLHGSGSNFDCYLRNGIVVRSWDGYLFYARPRTSDLYAICCEEVYELKNWFKPHAKGVVVDVGAYIGTYTVRAMYSADLVIAIEPLPYNFRILQTNIRLNLHKQKAKTILINKAVAEKRGSAKIFVPIANQCIGTGIARLEPNFNDRRKTLDFNIDIDTLDNILNELNIDKVDFLKIDIESYVSKALSGMIDTLKKTKRLFIELMGEDTMVVRILKQLGFKLNARHGKNFLFLKD